MDISEKQLLEFKETEEMDSSEKQLREFTETEGIDISEKQLLELKETEEMDSAEKQLREFTETEGIDISEKQLLEFMETEEMDKQLPDTMESERKVVKESWEVKATERQLERQLRDIVKSRAMDTVEEHARCGPRRRRE